MKPLAHMYDGHVRTISLSEITRLSVARFPTFRPNAHKAVSGPKPLFRLWRANAAALRDRWITTLETMPTRSTTPHSDIRVADAVTEF